MSITTVIKSVQDIMRKDAGVDGDAQRLGQLSWLLFLKIFDARELAIEEDYELDGKEYICPIPTKYLWRNWAVDPEAEYGKLSEAEKKKATLPTKKALTDEALLDFINGGNDEAGLFPTLKNFNPKINNNPRGYVVKNALSDAFNYMKNGILLRQVINKLNEIDFNKKDERHLFGDIYEQILKDLQSAGNAGEFYTPRAVTQFIVDRIDPQFGESILDPACGTGGFLACAVDYLKPKAGTVEKREQLQQQIFGVEKKQLPHLLCTTNMMLHGIEVPSQIRHENTLKREVLADKEFDIVITNPPFGGQEEDGIESDFSADLRTRETADLFLQYIIDLLADKGRAAIVLPDGTLFGEGVKSKIKEKLTRECNLHTILRLPNGVFNPYTGIKTNILFFTKGESTQDIWFYEHPYPEGVKNYSKTKPMKFAEFKAEQAWWGKEADGFKDRVENKYAWKIDFSAKKSAAKADAQPHWNKAGECKEAIEIQKTELLIAKEQLKQAKADKAATSEIEAQIKGINQRINDLQAQVRTHQAAGDAVYYAVFNFDIKNPHQAESIEHDPQVLLNDYQQQQAEIQALREQLKGILAGALSGEAKA